MKYVLVSFSVACASLSGCSASDDPPSATSTQSAIVNGSVAPLGEYPNLVQLRTFTTDVKDRAPGDIGKLLCGGTVVAPQWVLTSAYCAGFVATYYTPKHVLALIGGHKTGEGAPFTIRRVIPHPLYKTDDVDYDIALLELDGATTAPPVRLATSEDIAQLKVGTLTTAAGWGNQQPNWPDLPDALKHVDIPVADPASCIAFKPSVPVDRYLCVGLPWNPNGPCAGDFGGPLFASIFSERVQVAISSRWSTCVRTPGIFPSVAAFRAWILQTINCKSDCDEERAACTSTQCGCENSYSACMWSCGEPTPVSKPCCEQNCMSEFDSCQDWNNNYCFCESGRASCMSACGSPLSVPEFCDRAPRPRFPR